jgi:hypothetical protein
MTRTLSAKAFQLNSYSADAFQSFKINQSSPSNDEGFAIKPNSAKSSIPSPKFQESILNSIVGGNSHNPHSLYCSSFGPHMVTAMLSYHPRQKLGNYGFSNRISFLKRRLAVSSVCPSYPASYHGIGGENRPSAMGLTEAGCPSPEKRSLNVSTAYGDPRLIQKRTDTPTEMPSIPLPQIITPQNYPERSIGEVLGMKNQIFPRISDRIQISKSASERATRYSANTEWTRNTKHLTEGDPCKHHFICEKVTLSNIGSPHQGTLCR